MRILSRFFENIFFVKKRHFRGFCNYVSNRFVECRNSINKVVNDLQDFKEIIFKEIKSEDIKIEDLREDLTAAKIQIANFKNIENRMERYITGLKIHIEELSSNLERISELKSISEKAKKEYNKYLKMLKKDFEACESQAIPVRMASLEERITQMEINYNGCSCKKTSGSARTDKEKRKDIV